MIRTQISISERQARQLRNLARATGRSQAALIRDAIDLLVSDDERLLRIERARQPISAYRSGQADTAKNHDEVLDEAFGA
ncbi:MAG: hypothetical protein DCC49_03740 [Acidobacteria bacterium]|nr:MAG: hypothetical protein DCC49_03740 [Acidobacteriota bacterium]